MTKNIAITDMAYQLLVRHKRPSESFSKVILEHFLRKKHFLDYAGAWEHMPDAAFRDIRKQIAQTHRGIDQSLRKRIKVVRL